MYLLCVRDAAAPDKQGMLQPVLRRWQAGVLPDTVFALPALQVRCRRLVARAGRLHAPLCASPALRPAARDAPTLCREPPAAHGRRPP